MHTYPSADARNVPARAVLYLSAAWLILAAGCGKSPVAEAPVAEVRGEPIAAALDQKSMGTTTKTGAFVASQMPAAPKDSHHSESNGTARIGFDKLSNFAFEVTDQLLGPVTNNVEAITAQTEALIPAPVKALNKTKVEIKGFMLPLKVEGGLVTELLIMKDQSMCCYGVVPKINEWVSVKMVKRGVKPVMDQAVVLSGMLYVGEQRENGYLVGIYRMDGEKMIDSLDYFTKE